MRERDEDTGRYSEAYPQEAFLEAIRHGEEPVSTGEIAREVGCDHDTAYKRLRVMENQSLIESRKIGNTLVWSISSEDNNTSTRKI